MSQDLQKRIAELEALIEETDAHSRDLIRLHAGLGPVNDYAQRHSLELKIDAMIADVAVLRAQRVALTATD